MNSQYQNAFVRSGLLDRLNPNPQFIPPEQMKLNMLIELLRNGQNMSFIDKLRPIQPQTGTDTIGVRG